MTDPTASSAPIAAPKADPETLVLRAAPGRVTRFRRGAIVAIAAAGSTAIIGVAWLARKPATLSLIARSDEKLVGAKAPGDALAGAPTSYGDVPKLGLPLPGDLGRPILELQRQLGGQVFRQHRPRLPSRSSTLTEILTPRGARTNWSATPIATTTSIRTRWRSPYRLGPCRPAASLPRAS